MKARVTQNDIARVAGVHNTTVSLSLRNCPSIPEATRKRIRTIADGMGYYPDPALRALVAYRKGLIPNRPRETLAYITNWDTRWGWRALPAFEKAYIGARRKALELGYQLEHFWLGEPGMSQARLSSILYHRGISGVFVGSRPAECDQLADIDWSRLSAVQIGCFPHTPALHRVTDDHGGMARRATQRILAAGFERVGLVIAQWWDDYADQAWSTGYLTGQNKLPVDKHIPVLRLSGSRQDWMSGRAVQSGSSEMSALAKWYYEYRPEVIVGFSPMVLAQIEQLGLAVPRDVAYVDLCLECVDNTVAGMRQNGEIAGEVAAAMLVGQIQQNLRGLPTVATTTMVDGTWVDGASLPPARASGRCDERLKFQSDYVENVLLVTA